MNGEKIAKIFAVLIIVVGMLLSVQTAVQQVTDVPEFIEPFWNYIVLFFEMTPIIIILAFARNILGYARNYWITKHQEEYDISRLYTTWTYYIAGIVTVLAAVPPPYDSIAIACIVLLDFITSEIKKLKA